MITIRQVLVVVFSPAFLLGNITNVCSQPPSRQAVIEFATECRRKNIDIDLIAKFGKDFRNADLSSIDLGDRFRDGLGTSTNLRGADLSKARLDASILNAANLEGANLTGASLRRTKLSLARFTDAKLDGVDATGADFAHAYLQHASLRDASLFESEIGGADFHGADLSQAVLRKACCIRGPANFFGANLTGADLTKTKLFVETDFRNANLTRAKLAVADLERADFTGAELTDADFTYADVKHAIFQENQGEPTGGLKDLVKQAARSQYDRQIMLANIVDVVHVIGFFLAPIIAIGLAVAIRRRAEEPRRRILAKLAFWTSVVAFLGVVAPTILGFFGSHVAQFNGEGNAWSNWLRLFPLVALSLLGTTVAAGIIALYCLVRMIGDIRSWTALFICWLCTALHCFLQLAFLGKFAPTA